MRQGVTTKEQIVAKGGDRGADSHTGQATAVLKRIVANGGDRVAFEVGERLKDAGGYCNITENFTTGNKETKILVYAPWVKEHVIFKDVSLYTPKSDYGRMMSFLLGYTSAGKNKHDDVPDAFASLAKWKSRVESLPPVVGRRPF